MSVSASAEREMLELARSGSFRADMQILEMRSKSPFAMGDRIDLDAYVEFVTQFNEFINHRPKPFRKMIDKDMRL